MKPKGDLAILGNTEGWKGLGLQVHRSQVYRTGTSRASVIF